MSNLLNEFSIRACCTVLRVSERGFSAWQKQAHLPDAKAKAQADLKASFIEHNARAGAPKLVHDIRLKGHAVSTRTVSRWMQVLNLRARHPKTFKQTTDSNHDFRISPNLIKRDFTAAKPNQYWVGDITYLQTTAGWLYLATVIDLYSRAIVGWQISDRIDAKLVTDALQAAHLMRGKPQNVLFHSDRGSQYCSDMYRSFLSTHGFVQSMSRKGNCWDNAVAESFFKSLKTEIIYGFALKTPKETKESVFEYIEIYYNRIRRHSTIGYISPMALEKRRETALAKRHTRIKLRQNTVVI